MARDDSMSYWPAPPPTRRQWLTRCIDCGWDASHQPPEIIVCTGCGGRLVTASRETHEFFNDHFAWPAAEEE